MDRVAAMVVVSFLWHFPYARARSPLATVVALCCPDFPLAGAVAPASGRLVVWLFDYTIFIHFHREFYSLAHPQFDCIHGERVGN